MPKYKTIFSLRVRLALRDLGLEPLLESPNPKNPNLKCWMFEETPQFIEALNFVLDSKRK